MSEDNAPAKSSHLHEDKDWLIERLKGNVEHWRHIANYFIWRFCEETGVEFVDAWMEYEDYVDRTGDYPKWEG